MYYVVFFIVLSFERTRAKQYYHISFCNTQFLLTMKSTYPRSNNLFGVTICMFLDTDIFLHSLLLAMCWKNVYKIKSDSITSWYFTRQSSTCDEFIKQMSTIPWWLGNQKSNEKTKRKDTPEVARYSRFCKCVNVVEEKLV